MKNKKNILIIILITLLIIGASIFLINYSKKVEAENKKIEIAKKIEKIESHYNKYVKTNKEATLYKLENKKYVKHGKINKDVSIALNDVKISSDTKYFPINDLELYIKYEDVKPDKEFSKSDRYNNYIYFNKNIITNEKTIFYDEDDNYKYEINESFDFKVIIDDEDKYGVVYNNELLYIKKEDINKEYESNNATEKNKEKIRTLTYHFIYDPNTQECDQIICLKLDQFEEQLKYLRENNYFTLTLKELELYLDGKIKIPEKSIVLTIDDGTLLNTKALELLEKYKVNATLFVITSWVDPAVYKSDYLDLESHSDNMHNQYQCKGYGSQGGGILCLPEEEVLKDLKTSQDKVGGSVYFAYPFYDFNDRAISLLKQAGFRMAFIGQYDSQGYSYPKVTDKFKVRRWAILSDITMDEFISDLN